MIPPCPSTAPVCPSNPSPTSKSTARATTRRGASIEWTSLHRRQADGHDYHSRFKVAYSTTGLYVLMDGTDGILTATMDQDFMDLWNEDVFEVFLWTDERYPLYFEYEISPLNHELPILVPNFGGQVPGLASLALRAGAAHPQGDHRHRRAQERRTPPSRAGGRSSSFPTCC